MKRFNKAVSLVLCLVMLLGLLPAGVYASDGSSESPSGTYTIQNDYIRYSINAATGGFSVETLDGNPQKYLDDNIPLLYREDEDRSSGTSFTTVRIDGRDYVFGRDYSYYGISTTLHTPVVTNNGRLLTVKWDIMDFTVIKQVALSAEADQDLTGNVGISYTVVNNGEEASDVGIRVLLDTALDSTVDAPYLIKDTDSVSLKTETEFSRAEGTMPAQIRGVDSLNNPSKMLYTFTKTWNTEAAEVDRIIVGHWRNLANTRYEYTADEYCDFTNYSNRHRIPDAAIAYYWDEKELAAGAERTAEILYGVGNFSSSVIEEGVGIHMSIDNKVRLDDSGTAYVNDGKFDITVTVDNSVSDATKIDEALLRVSFDDGISSTDGIITQAMDSIEVGNVKTFRFHLKADAVDTITAKEIGVTLTGTKDNGDGTASVVTLNTSRNIILPGIKGPASDLSITYISPEIVYTEGSKTITLTGNLSPLKALEGTDGWRVFLDHVTSDHSVEIDKSRIAFLDEMCTQLSLATSETLHSGFYRVRFDFTDTQLVEGFGCKSITFSRTLIVSNNPVYRSRTFGLMALVRYNRTDYTFVPFVNQEEYNNFLDGLGRNGGAYSESSGNGYPDINGDLIAPFDPVDLDDPSTMLLNEKEVILILRGSFKETQREDGSVFYQASIEDSDIIINEILKYTGKAPLVVESNGEIFSVSGDGKLSVISSITVWPGEWSFQVNKGTVTTLDSDRCQLPNANELSLTLEGVGYMVQAIGGFLIDIKYGVMTSNRPVSTDRTLIYGISFGGSISLPIAIPDSFKSKKDDAQNQIKQADEDIDYSEALQNLFKEEDDTPDPGTGTTPTPGTNPTTPPSTTTTPTKPKKPRPASDFTKDTNLTEGLLSAAINDVRFGQEADENEEGQVVITDTGFIGIDATFSVGLPRDVLGSLINNAPGIYASVTINTIDHFYMVEAGLALAVIQMDGVLSFAMTEVNGGDHVVPDSIQFYIRDGLSIPLVPGVMFLDGLGGGIDGLADTIGGEFSKLPPLTVLLYTRLTMVETLIGDFNISAALTGASFDGDMSINVPGIIKKANKPGGNTPSTPNTPTTPNPTNPTSGGVNGAKTSPKNPANTTTFVSTIVDKLKSPVSINYGASVRWIDPFNLNGYGNISVIDGLLAGGVSITISANSFYGYAYLSLRVPDSIPIVGGHEIAGVEAAISNKFIGANLKLLGIKLGFIYYWDGDFNIGTGITLRSLGGAVNPVYEENAVYSTNLIPITKKPAVMTRLRMAGQSLTYAFDVAGQDALVIEIPYEAKALPTAEDFAVIGPNGEIPLIPDDGKGGGSYLVQVRDGKTYLYVTVTDPALIADGNWSVRMLTDLMDVETFEIMGVADIPEITGVQFSRAGDVNSHEFELFWDVTSDSESAGYLDVYLTKDPELLEKLKNDNNTKQDIYTLERIRLEEITDGSRTVILPETMDSGTYYVVAMLANDAGGMSTAITETTFTFVNKNLPKPIASAEIRYAGDGDFYVDITDAEDPDYTHYMIEVAAADGSTLENHIDMFEVGEDPYVGKEAGLIPGEKYYARIMTVRVEEDTNRRFYGSDIIDTDEIELPALDKPVLLAIESNIQPGEVSHEDSLVITYTFDRPVWMYTELNRGLRYANDMGTEWTMEYALEDGDYILDFTALGESKDSVTGSDFPDIPCARMGFSVDTVAPSLSIKQVAYKTVDTESAPGRLTAFESTTVFADETGAFVIEGITDFDAELTAEGNSVEVGNNGTFIYEGTLDAGETSREIRLKATDKGGNSTEIAVFAVMGPAGAFKSVELLADGNPIDRDEDGEAVITLKNGEETTLSLIGITADGREIVIDEPVWNILYEKNLVIFDEGSTRARKTGETAIKAGLAIAEVTEADGSVHDLMLEDYVVIIIEEGSRDELLADILAARENILTPEKATEEEIAAYEEAIREAEAVYSDEETTQPEVSAAIADLAEATEIFNKAKILDKTALADAITAAEKNLLDNPQAPDDAIAAYRDAITAAKAVNEDEDASKADVAAAEKAIKAATEAFDKVKKVDKTALAGAIADAEANYASGALAPDEAIEAYRDAIDAAIAVMEKAEAKQTEVDAARKALDEATEAFNAVKTVDKSALNEAIRAAEENLASNPQAPDEAIEAFAEAIADAKAVVGDEGAKQADIEAAAQALTEAAAAFNQAKVVDKSALNEAIADAEENLDANPQASEEAIEAFRKAIEDAKEVAGDPAAKQKEVDAAIKALADAAEAFDSEKNAARDALRDAIEEAEESIADPGHADEDEIDAFREAIEAAKEILDDPDADRDALAEALEKLEKAAKEFEADKRPGGWNWTTYYITVNETVNGTVEVSQTEVYESCSLTIFSTPDPWYVVGSVSVNGEIIGAAEIITIPAVTQDLVITVTFAPAWENPFIDVHEPDWFYSYVRWANMNGIVNGTTPNTFSPDDDLTRAMLVTILWRAEGRPAVAGPAGFGDIPAGSYYADAVAWAEDNGIVNGYSADEFAPEDTITREQFAAIMYRYANYKGYDVSAAESEDLAGFIDAAAISDYAVTAMRYAVGNGLINGRTFDQLVPKGAASRAESVTILCRFFANNNG